MDIVTENQEQLTRYLKFLEQDPYNLNLLLSISNCYRQLSDFTAAQHYLDKAKAIDSEACIALQGILDLNQGHFHEAKEAITKALSLEELPLLRYSLAVCHYSLNELEESMDTLQPLLEVDEPSYDAEFLMAQLLYHYGEFDKAIHLLETLLEQEGPLEQTLVLLAQVYLDNEEKNLAENMAQQALIVNPNSYEARVIILLLQLAKENTTVSEINDLLSIEPNDSRLWFALGTTYFRNLEFQHAEEAHLKAAELSPNFYDNWVCLGWCQLFLSKLNEAQNCYQYAITLDEEGPESWGGLALVSALRNELTDAANLIAKAKELDPLCFLANIAQMIYLQHTKPEKIDAQFNHIFPNVADRLTAAMAIVLQEMDASTTLH